MLDVIAISLSVLALGTAIWSAVYSARQTRRLAYDTERREALKHFTELIGGLGRHFIAVHGMVSGIRDPHQLEKLMQGLVEAYNQKEITEKIADSTLLLPEHEERMLKCQSDFVHLNTCLYPAMVSKTAIAQNEIDRIAQSADHAQDFYHELRNAVRNEKA